MDSALKTYLARHAALESHPLEWLSPAPALLELVVVIPVLAEYPGILETLNDLAANAQEGKQKTAIIVVVNNRDPEHAAPGDIENNQKCIGTLRGYHDLPLALIDASSPGRELAPKEGVGHARKMGMDWGAKLLGETRRMNAPLICLDADTRVAANYLECIGAFFQETSRWGAVIDYAHPKKTDAETTPGILSYELYLRYCELGMVYARSPYAYHAIGSAMACSVRAYVASGGMKRRAAAEDFYFLQALAKTGRVEHIWDTTVQPSARCSHRAPIGTGKHMSDFLRNPNDAYTVYNPESYRVLRNFFTHVESAIQGSKGVPPLIDFSSNQGRDALAPLQGFLDEISFAESWHKILASTQDNAQRLRQFHTYFDALRSLRAIHHLRDAGLENVDSLMAIRSLMRMIQAERPDVATSAMLEVMQALEEFSSENWRREFVKQETLLGAMRNLTQELAYPAGLSNKESTT